VTVVRTLVAIMNRAFLGESAWGVVAAMLFARGVGAGQEMTSDTPSAQPKPEDCQHALAGARKNPPTLIERRVDSWLCAAEAPTAETMAKDLGGLSLQRLKNYNQSIETAIETATALTRLDRAKLLLGNLYAALEQLDATTYPPDSNALRASECWENPKAAACDSRFGGFSAAAQNRLARKECWESLYKLGETRGTQFRAGYLDWSKKHVPSPVCEKPPTPPRCLVAWCSISNKYGLGFRPAIQLGGTFGDGLGFAKRDGAFAGQLSASLGLRFFFASDKLDLHAGLGIGTSTASVATVEGESNDKTAAFLLTQLGVGAYNGMFGAAWLHAFDPRGGGGHGNGVSLFVDAVAVERLVSK
jgi:hypothetical protein